jgi:hypothetical protein
MVKGEAGKVVRRRRCLSGGVNGGVARGGNGGKLGFFGVVSLTTLARGIFASCGAPARPLVGWEWEWALLCLGVGWGRRLQNRLLPIQG